MNGLYKASKWVEESWGSKIYLIFANYFWAYFGVVPLKLLPHTKYICLCFLGKGMITGGAGATVFYNLKQRHPTLDLPVIDYDLALFFQPVLVLGISIGVVCNVIFADWMITVLLIIIFIGKKNHSNLSSTPFCYLAFLKKECCFQFFKDNSHMHGTAQSELIWLHLGPN